MNGECDSWRCSRGSREEGKCYVGRVSRMRDTKTEMQAVLEHCRPRSGGEQLAVATR